MIARMATQQLWDEDKLTAPRGRILVEADLEPVQGNRFQSTGYPNRGIGEFRLPNGTTNILVDSEQAMANWLEKTTLTPDETEFVGELKGISMIKVADENGKPLTNSVREGHRIASPYILGHPKPNGPIAEVFKECDKEFKRAPHNTYKKIFGHDANSLLHGLWMSRIGGGTIRVTRAITAFLEASNTVMAETGGVKNDHVTVSTKQQDGEETVGDSRTGVGTIPFHREEHTAEAITAYFCVDEGLLESYNLGAAETELLKRLALWKILRFIEQPFRPRTKCDLVVKRVRASTKLQDKAHLDDLETLIARCDADMKIRTITYNRGNIKQQD